MELTVIVAPMHVQARQWCSRNMPANAAVKTATEARTLRGVDRNTRVLVLETGTKFLDQKNLDEVLATRFTNVQRIQC
jgi:hypothetical protein